MRTVALLLLLSTLTTIGQIPESLVTERSVVILDLPYDKQEDFLLRGDWDEVAASIQQKLTLMGIDAIAYVHHDDWEASRPSKEAFQLFFAQRKVNHRIIVAKNENNLFVVQVLPLIASATHWSTEAGSIDQAFLRLGQEIKRAEFPIENFLSPAHAEVFSDIPFSKYSASTNYPDQIKRLKIGVEKFQDKGKNNRLEEIMSQYPFQYELFDYQDDDDAFRKGYQFILIRISTSGRSIKNLLNYRTGSNETDYISTIKGDSSKTNLRTIPVDALVHKYYFKQTVNQEVFVGKEWDADVTWEEALENLILNLRIAFKKI